MLTPVQIEFLDKVCPDIWAECNNVINVNGNVNMDNMNLTEIPVQFGEIRGNFSCFNNKLTSLKGSSSIIGGYFTCSMNEITSLEGGPTDGCICYFCEDNKLTNLIGAPEICTGDFWCRFNDLTSLRGCSSLITEDLICTSNINIEYLWGVGRVQSIRCDNPNKINEWIIKCMTRDIIFPHSGIYAVTLEENINWIKITGQYSCLLNAPKEIRELFSPVILNLVDLGIYNESKILC